MPFYTPEDVEERLNSPDNLPARIKHHDMKFGRTKGATDIPMPIRKLAAITAQEDTHKNVSEAFNLPRRVVADYSQGRVGDIPNEEIKEAIADKKQDAADKAIEILTDALGLLPEKLTRAKAKELSSVAKDMSQVHETLRKKTPTEQANIQFHIWAPQQKSVDDYEVIDV